MRRLRHELGRWVYPVHRLDRGTSGVLVVALDPEAAAAIGKAFESGQVEKEYLALVRGVVRDAGTVDRPIDGHAAVTDYEPLAVARDRYTLVRVRPRTGRSHQIRRHMKHLSHPVLGDTTHGDGRENRKLRVEVGLHRLALHAARIAFPHPGTGERVEAEAPVPDDLAGPLERLGIAIGVS
jgi:tRNA pseudouridine65 synthase